MPIGPWVRSRLGPFERLASSAYRAVFINLDDLATRLAGYAPDRILEVGCGQGNVARHLLRHLPECEYVGIDVSPDPGSGYAGPRQRVQFRQIRLADFAAQSPGRFDLVLFVDVIHHVPVAERIPLLREAAALVTPGGLLAIKDWERSAGLIHRLSYVADRYLSGDSGVSFPEPDGVPQLMSLAVDAGGRQRVCDVTIAPWSNNRLVIDRLGYSE